MTVMVKVKRFLTFFIFLIIFTTVIVIIDSFLGVKFEDGVSLFAIRTHKFMYMILGGSIFIGFSKVFEG